MVRKQNNVIFIVLVRRLFEQIVFMLRKWIEKGGKGHNKFEQQFR